jgi:hypothetical protein
MSFGINIIGQPYSLSPIFKCRNSKDHYPYSTRLPMCSQVKKEIPPLCKEAFLFPRLCIFFDLITNYLTLAIAFQ